MKAFTPMCQIHFKVELSRTMVKDLRAIFLSELRSNTSEPGTAAPTTVVEGTA